MMKPTPRHYFKFMEWLVPKVRSHRKRCTIRAKRKRRAQVGDSAVLECWTGAPYRSPVERLGEFPLVHVFPIHIDGGPEGENWVSIELAGKLLTPHQAEQLAIDDGFDSLKDFAEFFRPRYPFDGDYFEWDPTKPIPQNDQ